MITSRVFDPAYPEIMEYTLESDALIVKVINLGATITSIICKKDNCDVVLGYDKAADYLRFENYFGATIGRCANRIHHASFRLHDTIYHLAENDHGNSLHGGTLGFHGRIFTAEIIEDGIMLSYESPDMEEGYPGKLKFSVTYQLCEHDLHIHYHAVSDADTIVNFTNHTYFALQGQGKGSVDHQLLNMNADRYACNDAQRMVNGDIIDVKGTPFDFQKEKEIGTDIRKKEDLQIVYANGYDHYFLFAKDQEHVVSVKDTTTQHSLLVKTDLPGFHFYVPDYDVPQQGKQHALYQRHCGFCIETSFLPDAINLQEEAETLLKAKEQFHSTTTFTIH